MKDVVPGNLTLDTPLPKYSKWATSQIQFIKDRSIRDSYVGCWFIIRIVVDEGADLEEDISAG